MRNGLTAAFLTIVAISAMCGTALALESFQPYFLASDVEPDVYVGKEVFFLRPWGTNAASLSYVDICTIFGKKYSGRLIKISDLDMTISLGREVRRSGTRIERQVVIPKKQMIIARIYW